MELILIYLFVGAVFACGISVLVAQSIFYKPTLLLIFVVTFLWPIYLVAFIWKVARG